MINTNNLKHRLMAIRFAIWDLHLYMDTHGCDSESCSLMSAYKKQYAKALEEYECKYGPLSPMNDTDCTWATTPFPWVNCGGDC